MHENRETSSVIPHGDRSGKAQSRTPDVYAGEESDRDAVRKTRGQDGFAFSFLVGLLHSQQHAGLIPAHNEKRPSTRESRQPRCTAPADG
jgi:hypothetical protein